MRISQLAERTGVPATTLRFYESLGLLPAGRTPAGHRVYGQDAIERLAFIGAAKYLGLPLEEIAELLEVWTSGACADVKAELRPRVTTRLTYAEDRLAELTAFAATLRRALAHLDALPDRQSPCDPRCGFPGPRTATGPEKHTGPRTRTGGVGSVVRVEPAPRPDDGGERWRGMPVACSLTGDGPAERAGQWRRLLDGAEREEIADGMRLTLPADRAAALAALAVDEQRCCPFFDFRLHLDGSVVNMEVRAPADGAALLADLFSAA